MAAQVNISTNTIKARLLAFNITTKSNIEYMISIIMGSKSDFATMQHTAKILEEFGVDFETKIVSAHRTPKRLYDFCETAKKRGVKIIIAGAGGAARPEAR
jgi:5-(carboxyamino)imidazole ribonucleotide mutase